MITVELTLDNNQAISGFYIQGHAQAGPHGQDIVCAGVSSLVQASIMGIERHLGRDINLTQNAKGLKMSLIGESDNLTNAILETMLLGLTEIAKRYPKSVRIIGHRR
ncbi:hypothetical protein SRRS_21190 [Sporomusa rhizae]|uniref:ribosomal-processing cysteine protease Prp n=1 Tax=Sporomusa rhizae TaxID=357999 RepID=UPI00352B90A3